MEETSQEDIKALIEAREVAINNLNNAECFMLITMEEGNVKLARGIRDGVQKLAMVGAAALAIATMNNETLVEGGISYTDKRNLN